jgi:hypothetical protein
MKKSKRRAKSPKPKADQPEREQPGTGKAFPVGLWVPPLAALFLVTRLVNLTMPGLHYDEATYLYWGQVIGSDWSQRYIGAGWGGKQPLHAWLVALSERLLADPVFAGRFVSVLVGALAAVAVWLLAERLFSRRVAVLAVLLYIICPFTLLYDRQALIDSLLAAEALWIMYLSVRLLDRQEPLVVVGLALSFGAALLTKSISRVFPLLLPAALLVAKRQELTRDRLVRWLVVVLIAVAVGFAIYYFAFGSSDAAGLVSRFEQEYGRYTMPATDLLAFPWQRWGANAATVAQGLRQWLTIPLSLAAIASLLALPWLGRKAWFLGLWAVLPIVGQVAIAARFYQRYILFAIPPLLVLVAYLLEWGYQRLSSWTPITGKTVFRWPVASVLSAALLALLLFAPIIQDFRMLTDLEMANRATGGYYGLKGMCDYLSERAKERSVYLIVNYAPAPVDDGSAVLLRDAPNIVVLRVAPLNGKLTVFDPTTQLVYPQEFFESQEVYYASTQGGEADSWLAGRLELVTGFPNLRGDDTYVGLYRIHFNDAFR